MIIRRFAIACAAIALSPGQAVAADIKALPDYAYNEVAAVGVVSVAERMCPGVSTNTKGIETRLIAMYRQLGSDGYAVRDVQDHLRTSRSQRRVERQINAFRARYGTRGADDSGFCDAVRAEARKSASFAALLSLR